MPPPPQNFPTWTPPQTDPPDPPPPNQCPSLYPPSNAPPPRGPSAHFYRGGGGGESRTKARRRPPRGLCALRAGCCFCELEPQTICGHFKCVLYWPRHAHSHFSSGPRTPRVVGMRRTSRALPSFAGAFGTDWVGESRG